MKSIQNQYRNLQEGKITQSNFMKNVRMTLPQYITNVTSFKDTIKILKNKGILTESMSGTGISSETQYDWKGKKLEIDPQSASKIGDIAKLYDEEQNEYIGEVTSISSNNMIHVDPNSIQTDGQGALHEAPLGEKEIEKAIKDGKIDPAVVIAAAEKAKKGDSTDLAILIFNASAGLGQFRESIKEAKEAMPKGNSGKELYSEFAEADNLNQQEIITGITIEHELAPEKSYNEIAKLVIKNVKKESNYYTNWKLSGVKGFEPKYMDNVNPDNYRMKFLTKDNLIDKPNVMKPVKGFADAKASANKAKKETNDIVKGVEEFGLTAKSTRGVQKMDATGTKMKKIVMKEVENTGLKNTSDEQYLAKVINTYLNVKKAMNKINSGTELDGFAQEMLDHTYLKNFPKSQIIAAVNKALNTQQGSTYTSQDVKDNDTEKNSKFTSSKVAGKVFSSPQQQALSKSINSLTKENNVQGYGDESPEEYADMIRRAKEFTSKKPAPKNTNQGYGDESPEEFADMQKRAKGFTKNDIIKMVREIMAESGIDGGDNMIDDEQTSMY